MRHGIVLTELIVTMVCIGIIASIAAPRLASIADAAAVRDETFRVVAALDAARGTAVRMNAVTSLAFPPAGNGVTLSGAGQPLLFGPAGLAMGASNRTIILTKGNAVRRVVISRLGRITY